MKCFIVLATLAVACNAQYYIADTPEVQAAKAQFAAAWNEAAQRNTIHPVAPVAAPIAAPVAVAAPVAAGLYEDGETYPAAVPYVHEEIAAEPYVHQEIPAEPYVYIGGPAAPVAAPVAPVAAPVQFAAPVQSGCLNFKGEAVPCRY